MSEQDLSALRYIDPTWTDQELWRQYEIAKEAAKIHGTEMIFKIGWCLGELKERGLIRASRKSA